MHRRQVNDGLTAQGTPANGFTLNLADAATLVICDRVVVANDTDPEGDALSVTAVAVNADGTTDGAVTHDTVAEQITYTPGPDSQKLAGGETVTDSFTYTVTDVNGDSATATVTVTVFGVNDAPTAVDDEATLKADVVLNDRDPDNGASLSAGAVNTDEHNGDRRQ